MSRKNINTHGGQFGCLSIKFRMKKRRTVEEIGLILSGNVAGERDPAREVTFAAVKARPGENYKLQELDTKGTRGKKKEGSGKRKDNPLLR